MFGIGKKSSFLNFDFKNTLTQDICLRKMYFSEKYVHIKNFIRKPYLKFYDSLSLYLINLIKTEEVIFSKKSSRDFDLT
jgi:hypothetical protein